MEKETKNERSLFYVKRVEIQNLACFGWGERKLAVEFQPRPGWQAIVGSAGSGKTTLLRTIAATLMGPSVVYRGPMEQALSIGAALGTAKVTGEMEFYALEWREGGSVVFSNPSPLFGQKTVPHRTDGYRLPVAGFGATRRFRGEGREITQDLRDTPNLDKVLTLLREDAMFLRGLPWLRDLLFMAKTADMAEEKAVAQKHFDAVMAILRDGLVPRGDSVVGFRTESTYPWPLLLTVGDAEVDLIRAPDTHRAIVGLVLELCRLLTTVNDFSATGEVTIPAIVLIDEPELHLGALEQRAFKQWLLAHFPNTQFIVATNSPDICEGEDEPIRLSRSARR